MRKRIKKDFATIFHLAKMFCEQYNEMNLCLPQESIDW